MKIIDSIHNQQSGQIVRNSALRKAAVSPRPPQLTDAEASQINKAFSRPKPVTQYNMRGDIKEQDFNLGQNIDTRV